ncbi:hypothetical protein Ciccas_005281 [Cichlidogyrus casuarinus]|uniref:Uncharacterized protein n=1 Tax=Cichlidogyrus casuarinus TaxID=1844966 RepID=A0ABD2Q936_9PLAT
MVVQLSNNVHLMNAPKNPVKVPQYQVSSNTNLSSVPENESTRSEQPAVHCPIRTQYNFDSDLAATMQSLADFDRKKRVIRREASSMNRAESTLQEKLYLPRSSKHAPDLVLDLPPSSMVMSGGSASSQPDDEDIEVKAPNPIEETVNSFAARRAAFERNGTQCPPKPRKN